MTSEDYRDTQKFNKMEQVEVTKTDVEKKVERILKLIKRRNRGKKEPELVGLVEDFHKQYQFLYAQYDYLRRESGKKSLDGKGNESYSYYASGSDSDYYSSRDIDNIAFNNDRSFQRRMAENMQEELERAYGKIADASHQLASKTEEKEALASDHLAALSKIQEIETINRDLRKEVDEKEMRLSALDKAHKGRVMDLEEQLIGLKKELESQHHQKKDLEAQLDCKTTESKLQRETYKVSYGQIPGEGDEVTKLMKQIEDNERNLTSKIEDSMAQIIYLNKEVDYLRARKCEAEGSITSESNESFDQANVMKQELDSLRSQKTELEILLEKKSKETSQYLIQVKTLKEELARRGAVEQIMVEEKEGLQVQVMELESEVDALLKQKNKLEDEERGNIHEINQLREEKSHLNARIVELEALFLQAGLELSAIQEDSESKRIRETTQIMALNAEVELLQQKLDSMKMEKSQLESRIADQQRIMKERGESPNNSTESNSKLARRLSSGTNFNLNVLERKMEDLAQEFRKRVEDNIRLLYQRITVAEKIHFENKDIYKNIKERLEQENGALVEKLAICEAELNKLRDSMEPGKNSLIESNSVVNEDSQTCISNVKDELVSTNDIDTVRQNEMEQLKADSVVAETDKENKLLREKVLTLEAKLSEEGEEKLKLLKAVVELETRVAELEEITKEKQTDKENELLREKVSTLEAKLSEKGEEKLKLLNAMAELETRVAELEEITKEKHETLLGREEEKREAIRELCVLIDYHRCRCDYLKELISKLTVRSKKKT